MNKKRNGWQVMYGLIGLIKPLLLPMTVAIIMGTAGHLCATFITVLGGYGILSVLGLFSGMAMKYITIVLISLAVFRGILRYSEQACNHYIAFRLLARIRHMVFQKLRILAPAKLDGREKGNLIAIITTDIELLEVFYAHTISPICIAVLTSGFMVWFIGKRHIFLGLVAFLGYFLVGILIPMFNGKLGAKLGQRYREKFGELNSTVLDNLRGIREINQYAQIEQRKNKMNQKTEDLKAAQSQLKRLESWQRVMTDISIIGTGVFMIIVAAILEQQGKIDFSESLLTVIAIMSSFGPVAALSSLSNNLHQTLASGNRVLNLLEEEAVTKEVDDGNEFVTGDIQCNNLTFYYNKGKSTQILSGLNVHLKHGTIIGIHGKSGCGKSTFLKLLMRFFETTEGEICYRDTNINKINTKSLRAHIAYVEQETFLFHDTIENNLKIAKEDATMEEVISAAKKASIHDFIEALPQGYKTIVSELGSSVSGGEKQRIGIARAFLKDSDYIFLDEPTSNLDSLNEAVILKTLKKEQQSKTIVLVSHRRSTMNIADTTIHMEETV